MALLTCLFSVAVLRQAADFRKGYGNWRSKKSKGARGETNYLTDKDKLHATDAKHEEVSSSFTLLLSRLDYLSAVTRYCVRRATINSRQSTTAAVIFGAYTAVAPGAGRQLQGILNSSIPYVAVLTLSCCLYHTSNLCITVVLSRCIGIGRVRFSVC